MTQRELPSPHFKRAEFACRCGCGADDISPYLVACLEDVRKALARAIIVTSGVRCKDHNAAVGGVANSQHLHGEAADITANGITARQLAKVINMRWPELQTIVYDDKNFVHVALRRNR